MLGNSTLSTPMKGRPVTSPATPRYLEPDWFSDKVFNPAVKRLTNWGISLKGSRVLEVPGRTSGEVRSTVVNLLTVAGQRYLVAPRGETQWVRNLRAAGGNGTLRLGKRREPFHAIELADGDKAPILRGLPEGVGLGSRQVLRRTHEGLLRRRRRCRCAWVPGLPHQLTLG